MLLKPRVILSSGADSLNLLTQGCHGEPEDWILTTAGHHILLLIFSPLPIKQNMILCMQPKHISYYLILHYKSEAEQSH